jgi:hypothetical protein
MSGIVAPKVTQQYSLGPVKSWVQAAAYFLGPRHGVKTIYGWRATDEFPDHPSGHAIDLMITSKSQGDSIAQDAINNATALGIVYPSYLIWYRRSWDSKQGWHAYTSTSNPHTDHVHITMWNAGTGVPGGDVPASLSDDDSTVANEADSPDCAWKLTLPVAGDICIATHKQLRQTFGVLLMGASGVVGLIGIVLLVAYGLGKSQTVKDVSSVAGRISGR